MDQMTRREIVMDSAVPAKLDASKFPDRAANAVETLNSGLEAGGILKARLEEAKQSLNRSLEEELKSYARGSQGSSWSDRHFLNSGQPESLRELYYWSPGLHILKTGRKLAQKAANSSNAGRAEAAATTEFLQILDKYQPAADAIEYLKGRLVKKESKAEATAKARAAIPKTKVSELVERVVRAQKPDLVDDFAAQITSLFKRYAEKYGDGECVFEKKVREAFKNDSKGRGRMLFWLGQYSNHVAMPKPEGVDFYPNADYKYKIDKSKIAKAADRYADAVINSVIDKIMTKAGDLQNPEVKDFRGAAFEITGEWNGKKVRLEQSVKLVVNQFGMVFNQFPCLIYVDGKMMPEATYKTMLNAG